MAQKNQKPTTPEAGVVGKEIVEDNAVIETATTDSTDSDKDPKDLSVEGEQSVVLDNSREKRAQAIFKTRPDLSKLFVTSDTTFFDSEVNAKSHAKRLDNKSIHITTRG